MTGGSPSIDLLVGFVDVLHDLPGVGCCAGLLVLNQFSEPVEFVFNRADPGCSKTPLLPLWPQQGAARAEARALLSSILERCGSALEAVIAPEDHIDVRLVALELRLTVPTALLRADTSDVLRWVPGQPPSSVREAVDVLGAVASLAEPMERVRLGLVEALAGS